MNQFHEALKRLGIEDFAQRIWHSSSTGELGHIYDYIEMAAKIKDPSWFRPIFLEIVDFAERKWKRPESCFQHMPTLIDGYIQSFAEKETKQ